MNPPDAPAVGVAPIAVTAPALTPRVEFAVRAALIAVLVVPLVARCAAETVDVETAAAVAPETVLVTPAATVSVTLVEVVAVYATDET